MVHLGIVLLSEMADKHDRRKEAGMNRLTKRTETGAVAAASDIEERPDGHGGAAVERLAQYEDMVDELLRRQREIPVVLEQLRREGKDKSYRFREEFAKKLVAEQFIMLLDEFGLKVRPQ